MKQYLAAALAITMCASSVPAFASSTGVPVPELAGAYCTRFTVAGVEWAIAATNSRINSLENLIYNAIALNYPLTFEDSYAQSTCNVPGVVHMTDFVHR